MLDSPPKTALSPASSRTAFLPIALIALATLAAYSNSLSGKLIFDDKKAIAENPTIRQLWPIAHIFRPPSHGETVTGRPLLNASLAANYAISGDEVWSYHVANLLIHLINSLLLFGILRRTFLLPTRGVPLLRRSSAIASPMACTIALLWAVHPLQTESVTYIIQRAESLMGLFYLLTLYCVIRGSQSASQAPVCHCLFSSSARQQVNPSTASPKQWHTAGNMFHVKWFHAAWYLAAWAACLAGMATKEVMATAPLVVLLYDRAFLAGSFHEAWQRRRTLYLALASTWLLFGWLVYSGAASVGIGQDVYWLDYLNTQFGAIVHYLRLSVWPHPLLFDYGPYLVHGAAEIVPHAILVLLLLAATAWALWRRPKIGFLGAVFFLILAPTSSIIPACATQTIAEHRMYLPLAAVVVAIVVGGSAGCQWVIRRKKVPAGVIRMIGGGLATVAAVLLAILTFHRNRDYADERSIWQDSAAKAPGNWRPHYNLGVVLAKDGQVEEAIAEYRKAVVCKADCVEARYNLAVLLAKQGEAAEAIAQYQQALQSQPDFSEASNNLGSLLAQQGQVADAIACYRQALTSMPDCAEAHNNLANALASQNRIEEAVIEYKKALDAKPDYAEAHNNLAIAMQQQGDAASAVLHLKKALAIRPDYAEAHNNLAVALDRQGNSSEAIAHFQDALQQNPDYAEAHNNLGALFGRLRRFAEAVAHFQRALDVYPDHADAQRNLALALTHWEDIPVARDATQGPDGGNPNEIAMLNDIAWVMATHPDPSIRNGRRAVALAEQAVTASRGRQARPLATLAAAYAETGRFREAVDTANKALNLAKENDPALLEPIHIALTHYQTKEPFHEQSRVGHRPAEETPGTAPR